MNLVKFLITFTGISFFVLFVGSEVALSAESNLSDALQATMRNHPALRGKQAEVEAQGFILDSTKASRYPSISMQANNLDNQVTQNILRLQQPLWTFGRISSSINLAEAGLSAEEMDLLQLQRQLIEDTAAAYALVEGITQRASIADENIAQHEDFYDSIVRREEGQLATDADVQLANSRLIQARASKARTDGELMVALSQLEALTQTPLGNNQPVDRQLVTLPEQAFLEQQVLDASIEILYKQEQLNVSLLEIDSERTASRPTISFQVERSFSDNINVDDSRVGLVFESRFEGLGLASRGKVNSAASRADAARFDLDSTRIEVKRRAENLILDRNTQAILLEAQQASVDSLASTLESFIRQYENGLKTWIEVLNTQRELTELRMQLALIENNWLVSSLRLAAMTGNLDIVAGIVSE